ELHLTVARLRAVETGVPVVVAANTGPSAVVLPSGRVAARLPPLAAGALRAVVVPGDGDTPYVAVGEWLGAADATLTGGVADVLQRGVTAAEGEAYALSRSRKDVARDAFTSLVGRVYQRGTGGQPRRRRGRRRTPAGAPGSVGARRRGGRRVHH